MDCVPTKQQAPNRTPSQSPHLIEGRHVADDQLRLGTVLLVLRGVQQKQALHAYLQ